MAWGNRKHIQPRSANRFVVQAREFRRFALWLQAEGYEEEAEATMDLVRRLKAIGAMLAAAIDKRKEDPDAQVR